MDNSVQNTTGMNKLLLAVVLVLICFGVAVVYSASAPYAQANGRPAEFYMMSHLPKAIGGVVLMLFLARFWDYGHWKWAGRIAFIAFFVLSAVALVKGGSVKGANRWIFGIQPSEFMKLGLIIWVSAKLSEAGDNIKSVACTLVQPGIPYCLCALILVLQPNYSMLIMVTAIVVCIMLTAGVNAKYLGYVALAGIPLALVRLMTSTHSRARILAFFADEGEMAASNWQGDHALQALGNGGLFGTGFGQGVQKLGYLPEAHKDVVYAVIGEEFGFVGTFVILILFAILFAQGFKIARNSATRFGKYLALGLTLSLFSNFVVHVCVCVGLFPMTGQPLPFFSFGGTNLLYTSIAIGILLNISRPASGRNIKEPYTSGSSLESSAFRNFDYTRSGV
ncbi:cell division protein FtsW [Fibrobacter sp. UWH9]|uniref:FtsW/RodA/SpoVE family cell cycle protein n=1 Tax=unclassified Fibrobacter TaxID=2634177 RepID=UPI00091344C9|nr:MULTISPECIES: putative peptidoglycan glycosyltransferase FtsW [Fibrobacter]MCQ2099103.1 putative lipid II flippase FtsW [Fibrobacter sp.]MCL4101316.1 putative peptidoglycan glycosyltransferase FtsW [Fibrobacter succinogenes]OWV07667.1 cell division protein FtsW [Fibrobacter sp. UWH3]SHH05835.1 cell division protein FtsW [Fibrobacter sp. UWH9]SHK55678.1 cell division protein FtsW [Fibrobacter sp. UWH6]